MRALSHTSGLLDELHIDRDKLPVGMCKGSAGPGRAGGGEGGRGEDKERGTGGSSTEGDVPRGARESLHGFRASCLRWLRDVTVRIGLVKGEEIWVPTRVRLHMEFIGVPADAAASDAPPPPHPRPPTSNSPSMMVNGILTMTYPRV